jgi:hypothetical protein
MSVDEELQRAWSALAVDPGRGPGLHAFPVAVSAVGRSRAARLFPGGEEALLVDLAGIEWPRPLELPRGEGFRVARLPDVSGAGVVLVRRPTADVALFTLMAADLVRGLDGLGETPPARRLSWLIARVRAWQGFMAQGRDRTLRRDAERGLYGELVAFGRMIDEGAPPGRVLEGWRGPDDGLHDFDLQQGGAIEVKSSVDGPGFPVTVTSLEQLDPAGRQPLAVLGVRLRPDMAGRTLPELASALWGRLQSVDPVMAEAFALRLVAAGLLPGTDEAYRTRFAVGELLLVPVVAPFPALCRDCVPAPVQSAKYVLNLDALRGRAVDLGRYLADTGWVTHA